MQYMRDGDNIEKVIIFWVKERSILVQLTQVFTYMHRMGFPTTSNTISKDSACIEVMQ